MPGHGDDALGRVQGGEIERRPPVEPGDLIAGRNALPQRIRADLRIESSDAKSGQAVLFGEISDDVDEQIHPAVAAGVAG
jgi:hypothetical protein